MGSEDDDALEEFWGRLASHPDRDRKLDDQIEMMSEQIFDLWFAFDRPLEDGCAVVYGRNRLVEPATVVARLVVKDQRLLNLRGNLVRPVRWKVRATRANVLANEALQILVRRPAVLNDGPGRGLDERASALCTPDGVGLQGQGVLLQLEEAETHEIALAILPGPVPQLVRPFVALQ